MTNFSLPVNFKILLPNCGKMPKMMNRQTQIFAAKHLLKMSNPTHLALSDLLGILKCQQAKRINHMTILRGQH